MNVRTVGGKMGEVMQKPAVPALILLCDNTHRRNLKCACGDTIKEARDKEQLAKHEKDGAICRSGAVDVSAGVLVGGKHSTAATQ